LATGKTGKINAHWIHGEGKTGLFRSHSWFLEDPLVRLAINGVHERAVEKLSETKRGGDIPFFPSHTGDLKCGATEPDYDLDSKLCWKNSDKIQIQKKLRTDESGGHEVPIL
jgi:hypothetical protein